jgi:N-acetylglucosamine-6-sulfatase
MGYKAVRTDRWKYIHYTELAGMDELYDLKADPYEMKNLVADAQAPLTRMQTELHRLLKETAAS